MIQHYTLEKDNKPITLLTFGAGDISVQAALTKSTPQAIVTFANRMKPTEIGTIDESLMGKEIHEVYKNVIMIFNNPASIDAVIRALKVAKSHILNNGFKQD